MNKLTTLQSSGNSTDSQLGAELRCLGPWFHNLHLPDGTQTAPDHPLGDFPALKWKELASHIPDDLTGWRALDIGCNAGFYSLELARRGADVLAIDHDPHYLQQADWAARRFGLQARLRYRQLDVFGLTKLEERFDLVLFLGVFYHLRYPLLGLDLAASKAQRLFIMQTLSIPGEASAPETRNRRFEDLDVVAGAGWPRMAFIEHEFAGDSSNWWLPNGAATEAMLRSTGMCIIARPAGDTYVCTPDTRNHQSAAAHDAAAAMRRTQ